MINGVLSLVGLFANGVNDYFKHRGERKRMERKAELQIKAAETQAQLSRIESGDNAAINMDLLSAQNRGWKDDFLLLVVVIPLIMAFIPPLVPYVEQGFVALKQVPDWYMWVLLGVFIDTFGFRRILRVVLEKYISKKFN